MKRQRLAVYAAFIAAGAANTMLGPLLPGFQARWGLDDAASGLLFAVQFGASVGAASTVGWLAARFGPFTVIAPGFVLMAAACAGLAVADRGLAMPLVACHGLGFGLAIPAGNLAVAAMHPGVSVGPIAILNLIWSAGAVLAPLAVSLFANAFLPVLSALCLFLAVLTFALSRGWQVRNEPGGASGTRGGPATAIASAILFLYVGAEAAISGWLPARAVRGMGDHPFWTALPSVFWAAMLVGRIITPMIVSRLVTARRLLRTSLFVALPAAICCAWASRPEWLLAGGMVAGLAMAPVFPLTLSRYLDMQTDRRASGLIFSFAGLGGATVPALTGFVSSQTGDLRIGVSIVAASMAAMLWLSARLWRTAAPR